MGNENSCEKCDQKHDCHEVYRQLGEAKGPSVVRKVVVAFLLPLVVFIASLAASEKILASAIIRKDLRTGVGLLLALSATFVLILIIKGIDRHPGKDK